MIRIIFLAVLSASSLLLLDSAVKGTALLVLAGVLAMLLRRDSAATRHLVWLLAVVALLVVPVLSAMLPQWRALPQWATVQPKAPAVAAAPPSLIIAPNRAADSPHSAQPVQIERPSITAHQPAVQLPHSPAPATPAPSPALTIHSWSWLDALPLIWAAGFAALVLRLLAARWMLWNCQRKAALIGAANGPATSADDPVGRALKAARLQLGIVRPVTLLIHPEQTIPVVWGIFRCRLLLPAAARDWSAEQLRSVLLHELAHVRRGDTIAQLLAQIAGALHWFNPLVWLATWRLAVERERACDDLVLAGGVRPSAYAGHLLQVVTDLAPLRWTQSCGLAVARRSSLEGRLIAVLSKNLNRRGVSVALVAIALAIAVAIAVPVAMLRAAQAKPGADAGHQSSRPTTGVDLQPAMEQNLRWGQTVNGLRAAVVIRHSTDTPKPGAFPDLYLVVQNVSQKPLRLTDADVPADQNLRLLYLKSDGEIQGAIGAREPALGDATLQPGQATFLRMFSADKTADGHSAGALIAQDMLKNPRQSMVIHMNIDKAPAGAWTGKLVTGDAIGYEAAAQPLPKTKAAQALFRNWLRHALANGDLPGGLLGLLGEKVKEFVHNNPGYSNKMAPLVARIDATRDWTPGQVVSLMDDIAAVHTIPLETTLEQIEFDQTLGTGQPLPNDLISAPWGAPDASGLRVAWLLEPQAAQHPLGTALRSRVLFHNAGKNTVVFRAWTFYQVEHTARDAKGGQIDVESTEWLTLSRLMPVRLGPGEFAEANAPGIGVGSRHNVSDQQDVGIGSWVQAKAGDDVTITTAPLSLGGKEAAPNGGQPDWWLDFIKSRLAQDLPLPADPEDRKLLVYRAGMDLFGTPLPADEITAFVSDRRPDALDSLAKRLAHQTGFIAFSGSLSSGPTKFRLLPPDPDAAKKPRTARNPGQYKLGGSATLVVIRRPVGERITNEAKITFAPADATQPPPRQPHDISLPDGYGTWAAAWMPGGTVLWVQDQRAIRGYDFTNRDQIKETTFDEPVNIDKVPKAIMDALHAAMPTPPAPESPPPASQEPRGS